LANVIKNLKVFLFGKYIKIRNIPCTGLYTAVLHISKKLQQVSKSQQSGHTNLRKHTHTVDLKHSKTVGITH